jgi:hypothetical protein
MSGSEVPVLTHDDYEWVSEIVKRAAATVARKWPGIDRDDIEQEMWVKILPLWGKLVRDDDYVFKVACRAGNGYAADERYYYTHMSAEWVYTPAEVRGLFREAFFDPGAWEQMPSEETSNTLRSGGVVVSLWDLREVWNELPDTQRDVIGRVYRDGNDGDPQDAATRKALQRAIDAATRILNGRMATRGADRSRYELAV